MQLNHTVVSCSDQVRSSSFIVWILCRSAPKRHGPFHVVAFENGASLDYLATSLPFDRQHYAFLVNENEFDQVLERIRGQGLPFWADPGRRRAGEINRNDGGRAVYFEDPDGHLLEILTVPYGGWPDSP